MFQEFTATDNMLVIVTYEPDIAIPDSNTINDAINWNKRSATAVTVTLNSIALAFGVSFIIGVSFGFFSARKAAALNPIEALRFE